ncbi:MAG TPA: hypothetical protein VKI62_06965, partial [Bacteroidota bacterium]|nr:hypothetical protein [Bacteroidota bacterium]
NLHKRMNAKRALIGKGLPESVAQIFRRNGIFSTFIDFSVIPKHTKWMPFGQSEMAVNLGPAIIALRHHVPVVCVSSFRTAENSHRVIIHPPISQELGPDIHLNATDLLSRALEIVETDLAEHPEQWWPWNYARLRHRQGNRTHNPPIGMPNPELSHYE